LWAAVFTAVQGLVMWFAPSMPQLGPLFGAYAQIPLPLTISAGMAAGALVTWLGWRAGAAPQRKAAPAGA